MNGVFGWVARRRLVVLVTTLLVAVGLEVLLHVVGDETAAWMVILAVDLGLPVLLLVGAMVAVRTHHPATLVARPDVPAFETPADPVVVLGSAAFTVWPVKWGADAIEDVAAYPEEWFFPALVAFIAVVVTVLFWIAALGRFGVRLRPDGILSRRVVGSRFIPWDALELPHPATAHHPQWVSLNLVRSSGVPVVLPATGVSAELLARAVHEYANRPDLRPALGTRAELDRFQAIPQIAALRER
ncbi:hypothetical protein [Actinoplanes sp. NPDC023714]|uniref:hypothetical protein n=1 Tax=Actinoplanes sp. NPDC023714 TaxID=3154322 RepID=UPI0033C0C476